MTKGADVDLRIRAKNLAGKTLREINSELGKLEQSQRKQAQSAELAATSTKELVAQQELLAAATRELARRRDLTQQFANQRKEIGATAAKLKELTATYRQMQRGSGGNLIGFTDKDVRGVGRAIVQTESALNKLIAKNAKTGESLSALGIDANKAEQEIKQLDVAVARSSAAYDQSVAAIQRHSSAIERNSAAQAEAKNRLAAESAAQAQASARIRETVRDYDRIRQARLDAIAAFAPESAAQAEQNKRRAALIRLINSERGQRILNAEAQRRETQTVNQNTAAHTRNATAIKSGSAGLSLFSDTGRKSLGTYQRLRGQVLGLAAAYIGVYQAIATFQRAIDATTRNQALLVGLKTINNGDAQAAASDYKFLRQESDRLGLVFDDIAPKFANMAVAGKALGLTGGVIRSVFTDVATSVASMGLSVDDAEGVFRAIVQVMSKAKVQAEELRGQLGDRLPGAVAKFAEENGIALADLDKQLKDGTVGIDKLIKFLQGYSKQFEASMGDVTGRLQGHINRAKNAYNDFLRSLLAGANEQKLKDAFKRIELFFKSPEGAKFASKIAQAIGVAIDVFIMLANNVDNVALAFKAFIAVTILKFLIDTASGVIGVGVQMVKLTKFTFTYIALLRTGTPVIAAFNLALGAGTAASAGQAGAALTALRLGPLAGILAIAAAGIVIPITIAYNNEAKVRKQNADVAKTLTQINRGLGETERFVDPKTAAAAREQVAAIEGVVAVLDKRSAALKKSIELTRKEANVTRAAAASTGTNDHAVLRQQKAAMSEGNRDAEALQAALLLTEQRAEQARSSLGKRKEELARLEKIEAERDAASLKNLPKLGGTEEKKAKKEKDPASEENARLNAARAIQKELLDLDTQILEARINGEFTTAEQIEANYRLRLQQIANDIAEKALDIDRLAQNAKTAGVDQSGEIATARSKLVDLERALRARAEEDRLISQIQIKEKAVNDLIAKRDAEIETINTMVELGLLTESEGRTKVIGLQQQYKAEVISTVEALRTALTSLPADLFARLGGAQMIAQLDQIVLKTQKVKTNFDLIVENLGGQFAQGAANAFGVLAKGIAGAIQGTNSLGDAFKGAMNAFREFAADFLVQIGQMIMQAIILQAIKNAFSGGSGGFMDAVVGAFTQHTGGIAGSAGLSRRNVSPLVFAGAQRFHAGGMPGLKPNEVPTILEKGEEVLPKNNPRHAANAGAMGRNEVNITNAIDSASVFEAGANSPNGKRVIYNLIRADVSGFRKLLQVK